MSRASEITLILILIQASIGFVDATGLFTQHYLEVPSNNASYTISDLEAYSASSKENSIWNEIVTYSEWAVAAALIAWTIISTVLFVLPMLVNTFHIPLILSTFIQVGVYYVYATWYAQDRSGKGWKNYE